MVYRSMKEHRTKKNNGVQEHGITSVETCRTIMVMSTKFRLFHYFNDCNHFENDVSNKRLPCYYDNFINSIDFLTKSNVLRENYGRHELSLELTICRIVKKFEIEFTLLKKTRQPERNARNPDNIAGVRASVIENINVLVNRCPQEVRLSRMTTRQILKKYFGLHPFTISRTKPTASSYSCINFSNENIPTE